VQAEVLPSPAPQPVVEPVAVSAPVYQAPVSAPVYVQEPVRQAAQPIAQPVQSAPVQASQPVVAQVQPQQPAFQMPQATLQPEPAPMAMPEPATRLVFDLGVSQETFQHDMPAGHPKPQVTPVVPQVETSFEDVDRQGVLEARRARLKSLSSEISNEAIKEKLEVPAYLRRNVALETVVHSSERNISRFSLNDDNEILGDNRFLHDNVD